MKYWSTLFAFLGAIFSLEAKPMVYDCFLFLNELEILDIRLHEMNDVVDKFVLLESVETFRGDSKDLVFMKNADRFKEFLPKIIHVVFERRVQTSNPWVREYTQRDALLQGLTDCAADDIILISDVDEIVQKEGVLEMVKAITSGQHKFVGTNISYHTVFLNSEPNVYMGGAVATTYNNVQAHLPQGIRHMKDRVPLVAKGWHFTWQGGLDRVLYKMSAYSHAESDTPQDRLRTVDDYEKKEKFPKPVPLTSFFPQYVIDNQAYFESIGFVAKVPN